MTMRLIIHSQNNYICNFSYNIIKQTLQVIFVYFYIFCLLYDL